MNNYFNFIPFYSVWLQRTLNIADHFYDKASIYLFIFIYFTYLFLFFTWIIIIIYLFIFRLIQYRLRLGLHRSLFPHIETLLGKTWFKLWSSSDVWQCCLTDPVRQQEHRTVSLWLEVWGVEVCVKWQTMSTHPNEERNISPYICV